MRLTKGLRFNSVRKKLFFLVILNGGFALLLVGLLLFGYEKVETRQMAERELSSQAGIVADSTAAPLMFQDERAATDTLNALRADADIVQAAVYGPDDRLFAWYERGDPEAGHLPPALPRRIARRDAGFLMLSQPVRLGKQQLGTVWLKASMAEADLKLRRDMGFVSLALLASLIIALALTASMQRTITRPVAELASVARLVSIGRDYSARAVKYAEDEIGFLVDSFNDMLVQIQAREQALSESEERYALAARGSNDGLWDWKLATGRIYFSSRWNQMQGYPEAETWSEPESWFGRIHEGDRECVKAAIAAHCVGATAEFVSEYRIRQKGGAFVWVLCRGIAVRDASGEAVRIAGSQTDITQGKIADPLTGLPNRLYFLDRLNSALEASRRSGRQLAVLFLDMDRFKLINDSMGHAAGDALLEGVSRRLRKSLRAACSTLHSGESSFVARLGGDEFAILLDPVEHPSTATCLAEMLLRDLNDPYQIGGRQVFVGLSIGIAMSSGPENPGDHDTRGALLRNEATPQALLRKVDTPEELLRNADTAMYHAKTEGKARMALFDEGMRKQAVARLEIETELRRAIDNRELVLHYQPQISIATRRLTGFEALVRWVHPERGMVPPADFIPVAEETGLIVPLGEWVLRESCRQMVEWQRNPASGKPLTMAVNVSFKQLVGTGFIDKVNAILTETGLAPENLRLEMTESAVMKNPQEAIEILRGLKDTGLGLEIDDFGTGYSSLSYLSRLPFDTVKIDRSFVSELGVREDGAEIVKTILELARSLSMDAIAEGVENESQLERLIALGCGRAQGFYFSRPLTAQAVVPLLQSEVTKSSSGQVRAADRSPGPFLPKRTPALAVDEVFGNDLDRLLRAVAGQSPDRERRSASRTATGAVGADIIEAQNTALLNPGERETVGSQA